MASLTGVRAGLVAGLCLLLTGTAGTAVAGTRRPVPPQVVVGADRDGSRIRLVRGQALEVRLDGNPTTGYGWDVTRVNTRVLAWSGQMTYTPAPLAHPRLGSGGTFAARFTAIRPGETTLTLVYHRRFGDTAPARTFTVHVRVRHCPELDGIPDIG